MNYDELTVDHNYDVETLSDALVENFNFSEPDNPTGTKSDMLHYEGSDGQENGYAIVTEDTVTFVPYDEDIDDSWEGYAAMAVDELVEDGETLIPLDQLYDGDSTDEYNTQVWGDEAVDVQLDREFDSQHSLYF